MPKVVNHAERRALIIEAVTNIIMRDGFDRVTMREIAQEIGFVHGAITRYFPNKESLLAGAFVQVFTQGQERILRLIEGKRGLAALRSMLLEILPLTEEGAQRAKVVMTFWDRASQDPKLGQIHHDNIVQRIALIERCLIEAREDEEISPSTDIALAVNRIAAYNAGCQILTVLVPAAMAPEQLSAAVDLTIEQLVGWDRCRLGASPAESQEALTP